MNLLIGATSIGCILTLLGLGVFLSYRICNAIDLTADGAFGIGAAVAAALLIHGTPPLLATAAATGVGTMAGIVTGVVHTWLLVNALLAGVLTSTALYSVSLFAMGTGNISLVGAPNLLSSAEGLGKLLGLRPETVIFGTSVSTASIVTLIALALLAAAAALGLGLFLGTDLGLALRAAGSNPTMAKAVAIDVDRMVVLGLALANGLIALSGALLAQYEGFASIQAGVGALVTGLGGLLLGEALFGKRPIMRWIGGVVGGTVLFRLVVAVAVWAGLHPSALKLVTALLVLAVLALPPLLHTRRSRLGHA